MKEIDFIGVPMNLGSRRLGVELGPGLLRGIVFGKNRRHQWNDLGDIPCASIAEASVGLNEQLPYIDDISESCVALRDVVAWSLSQGHFPFVAGGDHVLTWGSMAGILREVHQPKCLYVDAHGDFNCADESPSHNVHGMHMCYLLGFDNNASADKIQCGALLKGTDLFFVGTRSLDPYEKLMVSKHGLHISKRFPERLCGYDNLHISFDIDVLDPAIAPGTGVPEPDGMTVEEVLAVLTAAFQQNHICSMDFVELNPLLDVSDRTRRVAQLLIDKLDEELLP